MSQKESLQTSEIESSRKILKDVRVLLGELIEDPSNAKLSRQKLANKGLNLLNDRNPLAIPVLLVTDGFRQANEPLLCKYAGESNVWKRQVEAAKAILENGGNIVFPHWKDYNAPVIATFSPGSQPRIWENITAYQANAPILKAPNTERMAERMLHPRTK